jgi:hypothetical protein
MDDRNDLLAARRAADPHDLIRELEAVLGRRVDELERDNRRLRRRSLLLGGGVMTALGFSAVLLFTAATSDSRVADVIQANRFVLRDADGQIRGSFGLTPEGGSRMVLQDPTGRERMRMTLLADGSPGMSFTDSEGRSRVVLGFLPDETANLVFADRLGRTRAVFGLMPDESSTLVFADRHGDTRVGLGIDLNGSAGLTLLDAEGTPAATETSAGSPEGNGADPVNDTPAPPAGPTTARR